MELLTEKYQDVLESKKHPAINEADKPNMAVLLENQEKHLAEATVSSDVADFTPIFMPLARRVQPQLIANEILGVQPLNSPTGYVYSIAFRYTGYGSDKDDRYGGRINPVAGGQIVEMADASGLSKGDVVSSDGTQDSNTANVIYIEDNFVLIDAKIFSAGADVYDNAATPSTVTTVSNTYSNELTFRKILKGYTGSLPTNEAELLGYDMKEIGFEVKRSSIGVESRKLKAEYTVEMYQDLKAMHGLNADEELMNMMSVEVLNEMDREMIEKVNSWCAPAADFTVGTTGSDRYEMESMAHFGMKIANESREIARLTRRGAGNVLMVSPKVATILEQLKGYKAIENNSTVNAQAVGASVIGTFNGMKVIMDAFATSDYCTVVYKGGQNDAIGIYAPYVAASFSRVVHPDTAQPAIVLNTRYGLLENPLQQDSEKIYGRTFSVNFGGNSSLA